MKAKTTKKGNVKLTLTAGEFNALYDLGGNIFSADEIPMDVPDREKVYDTLDKLYWHTNRAVERKEAVGG